MIFHSNPFEPSDQDPRSQILNSVLEEILRERKPPSIDVDSLKLEIVDEDRAYRLDQAVEASSLPLSKTVRTVEHDLAVTANRLKRRVALFALAASALIAIGISIYIFAKTSYSPISEGRIANAQSSGSKELKSSIPKNSSSQTLAIDPTGDRTAIGNEKLAVETLRGKTANTTTSIEELSVNGLPFSKDRDRAVVKQPRPITALDTPVLASNEITQVIDKQMRQLWSDKRIDSARQVSDEVWFRRANLKIKGRVDSVDELREFLALPTSTRKSDWVAIATADQTFFETWARRLANNFLPSSHDDSKSANYEMFTAWLTKRLHNADPLDEIVRDLILARGPVFSSPESSADSLNPEAGFWWLSVAQGNDSSKATDTVLRHFLGLQSSCVRCHDSSLSNPAVTAQNSSIANDKDTSSTRLQITRSEYWNLAAIASAVRIKPDPTKQFSVGYREDWSNLFYEQENLAMSMAIPMLPGGLALNLPDDSQSTTFTERIRENLERYADWIVERKEFSDHQANNIWMSMFDRELVRRDLLEDDSSRDSRNELAEFLGSQLRTSGYDLAKIVSTVALTEVFALDELDSNLEIDESQWKDQAVHELVFASYPRAVPYQVRSLESLSMFLRQSPTTILAQPKSMSLESKIPSSKQNEESLRQKQEMRRLIAHRRAMLPQRLEREANQWIASKMPWEQLVDHAFYVVHDRAAFPQEQTVARELRGSTPDRRLAILYLLSTQID